jgi:hypothetical protein
MAGEDTRLEQTLLAFVDDVRDALGDTLVNVTLYGSATGEDWVPARSNVNTMLVVRAVSSAVLEALSGLMPAWRRRRFAPPLLVDEEFLERSRDAFPIEYDDIHRAHRVLYGPDVVAAITVERAQLRRQCEEEARGKLLRLRAAYLDAAGRPAELEHLLLESLKTFLVILRHVVHLRGNPVPHGYADVLAAGERLLGPLPAFRRVLEHRRGTGSLPRGEWRAEFRRYLADVERVVAAVDTLHA